MAASARAAARAIASHRGHFDESVFADDDVDAPDGGIRMRDSTEAMGRAQEFGQDPQSFGRFIFPVCRTKNKQII